MEDRMDALKSWQDRDMLNWLGREAPRYTSYPSAHHFEAVDAATYEGWLRVLPDESVGVYVHVPFCEQMCWFCGCNTQITRRSEPVEAYIGNLIAEIAVVSAVLGFRPKVHSLHFGGGSPGIVAPDTMARLFDALHAAFDIGESAEISIELDPRRLTPEKADAYVRLGFTRVSLGVQDTQGEVQAAINRIQPMDMVARCVGMLRDRGLVAIGIDLIYGLPKQTAASIEATLRDVAKLDPQRISAFSYAHVPWVKKHQRLIDETRLPDMREKLHQYLQIDTGLSAMGYAGVGMDHFAKPDDGLAVAATNGTLRRNFMGYTDMPNDRLIGLGASSISELDEGLAQNIPQATSYETKTGQGILPTVRGWRYRGDDRVRGDVISSLMCRFTADVGAIAVRHGLPEDYFDAEIEALRDFVAAGVVTVSGRAVTFDTPLKMLVRSVACVFDLYASGGGGNRYSRVA
jgi:oxygen-independent coproporphyrinogen-3 oxidase